MTSDKIRSRNRTIRERMQEDPDEEEKRLSQRILVKRYRRRAVTGKLKIELFRSFRPEI